MQQQLASGNSINKERFVLKLERVPSVHQNIFQLHSLKMSVHDWKFLEHSWAYSSFHDSLTNDIYNSHLVQGTL